MDGARGGWVMIVSHRANPPTFTRYSQYKPYVREDFRFCCAYCVSHEAHVGELWAMTLDHFKPKKRFRDLAVTYRNLYYACCRCNTYKGDTWPSAADLRAGRRFVDACLEHHTDHIAYVDGKAVGLTSAGGYSIEHLRLNRRPLVDRRVRLGKCVAAEFATFEKLQRLASLPELCGRNDAESTELKDTLRSLRDGCLSRLRGLIYPSPLDS
jgi:hypothetical protein